MLLCGILTAKDGKYRLKQAQKDMLKISVTVTENKLMLSIKAENILLKTEKFIKNSNGRNCESICKAIYYTLMDFKCDKSLKALAIDLDNNGMSSAAKELGRVWDLLMNILNELATVSTDESITYKEFYDLFAYDFQ